MGRSSGPTRAVSNSSAPPPTPPRAVRSPRIRFLPLHKGTLASYVVRPRDYFHFNKVYSQTGIGSITVQGEVRFPGNYPLVRGEHLSEVLLKVGGLTPTAYPSGTVFLRRSAAKVEQDGYNRAADQIQTQLLAGMPASATTRSRPRPSPPCRPS